LVDYCFLFAVDDQHRSQPYGLRPVTGLALLSASLTWTGFSVLDSPWPPLPCGLLYLAQNWCLTNFISVFRTVSPIKLQHFTEGAGLLEH
jgi:hypothetical protein